MLVLCSHSLYCPVPVLLCTLGGDKKTEELTLFIDKTIFESLVNGLSLEWCSGMEQSCSQMIVLYCKLVLLWCELNWRAACLLQYGTHWNSTTRGLLFYGMTSLIYHPPLRGVWQANCIWWKWANAGLVDPQNLKLLLFDLPCVHLFVRQWKNTLSHVCAGLCVSCLSMHVTFLPPRCKMSPLLLTPPSLWPLTSYASANLSLYPVPLSQ